MLAVPTTCPFCSCGCGLYLLAREGELVGVAPSESHPVSAGKLCARGWSAHEAPLWGERLRQPMLRRNGKQDAVSWDAALDHITVRLQELMSAGKPVGVLGSARATNEENYLLGKLARAGLGANHVDFSYHPNCDSLLAGIEGVCGGRNPSLCLHDIASSHVILLTEGNLAETHPRAASVVLEALDNGARLITIGWRSTQMTRLASLHLRATPGSEGALIESLLSAALELKPQEATGGEGTGEVRQAAEWIARAERAAFMIAPCCGQGDRMQRDGAAFARLAEATGHLDKPGSGLLLLLARNNVRGACDMGVAPDRLPGYEPLDDSRARERVEAAWGHKLPATPGWSVGKLLQSVSGLIVLADDPPSVAPMGLDAMAALGKIEFLVVLDAFSTPTARMAHALLPIASFAETDGSVTNLEGRLQRVRAAASPPGEARSGWQVLAGLCGKFGMACSYASAAEVLREISQAAPAYSGMERLFSEDGWGGVLLKGSDRPKSTAWLDGAWSGVSPSIRGASVPAGPRR